jgi:hypothetical protein
VIHLYFRIFRRTFYVILFFVFIAKLFTDLCIPYSTSRFLPSISDAIPQVCHSIQDLDISSRRLAGIDSELRPIKIGASRFQIANSVRELFQLWKIPNEITILLSVIPGDIRALIKVLGWTIWGSVLIAFIIFIIYSCGSLLWELRPSKRGKRDLKHETLVRRSQTTLIQDDGDRKR